MDLQPKPPQRLPKSKSLANYEQWKQHERQIRRSQSQAELAHGAGDAALLQQQRRATGPHGETAGKGAPPHLQGAGQGAGGQGSPNGSASSAAYSSHSAVGAGLSPARRRGSGSRRSSVQHDASLLDENGIVEYATLELRVHPPSVKIDNTLDDSATVVIVDSANRPGTLVEVVERLTELGLAVRNAQISSDGGWFVDVFHVTNAEGEKVTDRRTLWRIENILDLDFDIFQVSPRSSSAGAGEGEGVGGDATALDGGHGHGGQRSGGEGAAGAFRGMNVIEMLVKDEPGLLMRMSQVVTRCHMNIFDTLLWSHRGYAAVLFTVSVSPGQQLMHLDELKRALEHAIEEGSAGSHQQHSQQHSQHQQGETPPDPPHHHPDYHSFVQVECSLDTIYVEKRFYRLKMKAFQIIEEATAELARKRGGGGGEEGNGRPLGASAVATSRSETPQEARQAQGGEECTSVRYDAQTRYTNLYVHSRDRPQLLFDTVCTLSDLSVDVFHATIDTDSRFADMEFFVKSSSGSEIRSEAEMGAIEERLGRALKLGAPPHPGGPVLCLQVAGSDYKGLLHRAAGKFFEAGLDIAYCTSRTDPVAGQNTSVFYLAAAGPGLEELKGKSAKGKKGSEPCFGSLARLSEIFEKDLGLGLKELGVGKKRREEGLEQQQQKQQQQDPAGIPCCKTSCANVVALIEKLWNGTE
mmetsp:Transcript_29833/g.63522  ORF Transcript_29833/g.63522 Transcript_29833/m.63522 type:complete len:694 (+) Transcript_29833:62-2143(+)